MDKTSCDKTIHQSGDLLNLLRFFKGIDRSELSRRLKLSMPTVYNAVDELTKIGIVKKEKTDIFINENYGVLVGMSIGSSLCKIVFLDMNYKLINEKLFLPHKINMCEKIDQLIKKKKLLHQCITDTDRNYVYFNTPDTFSELKMILDCIFGYIVECIRNDNMNVLCIGISCTGIINKKTQTILSAHNLNYLDNCSVDSLIFPGKQEFFEKKQINVHLIQNSDASMIAEKIDLYHTNSIYKSRENIASIYLGVGFGVGLYFSSLYSGTSGYAGEIGHTLAPDFESINEISSYKDRVSKNEIDTRCTCGSRNCYDYKFRSYVMGMSLKEFREKSSDEIREYLISNPENAKLLGKYLGHIINIFTNWLNVDLIIFTGKLYKSMDVLMDYIEVARDENPLKFSRMDCKICRSRLGSSAPAIGAAIYAYHKKYDLEMSWNYY